MVLGSGVEVVFSPGCWWLHTLESLPQLPVVTVVILSGGGAAENAITEQVQEVGERQENYLVQTLD